MALRVDEPQLARWMREACGGNGRSEAALLTALSARLRAYFRARGLAPDLAEDLVQETLIAIHTKRGLYDPDQPLLRWVHAIARYRLIDWWRREGRRGLELTLDDHVDELADEAPEPVSPRRDLVRLLARLPDKQRRAIQLVKLEERSVQEAAELTGWSASDVKVSAHRGLKALMKLVGHRQGHEA